MPLFGRQTINGLYTYHLVIIHQEGGHFCLEVHFAPTIDNGIAYCLDYLRQLVGANMRVGI